MNVKNTIRKHIFLIIPLSERDDSGVDSEWNFYRRLYSHYS